MSISNANETADAIRDYANWKREQETSVAQTIRTVSWKFTSFIVNPHGDKREMKIPVVIKNNMDYVQIDLPLEAFKTLAQWASIGRMIDNTIHCLESSGPDMDEDAMQDNGYAVENLTQLKSALSACHQAVQAISIPNTTEPTD